MKHPTLQKIVSGAQTGADRAALDFAIAHQIRHGGWCPFGRMAEDGTIDWIYKLKETPSSAYAQRTEWNVRDSDGTLLFSFSKMLFGGTRLTSELALKHKKPVLHIYKVNSAKADQLIEQFIERHQIRILNVAGPRASTAPQIGQFVKTVLESWWNFAINSPKPCSTSLRQSLTPSKPRRSLPS